MQAQRTGSLMSGSISQELACASFGQAQEVFDFQVVVQLSPFVCRQRGHFLALDQIPDALARRLGGLEVNDLSRAQ